MRTIENFFSSKSENCLKAPVKVKIKDNKIFIDAVFSYNKAALKPWIIDGLCQADLIEAAVINYWSGMYRLRSDCFKGYIKTEVIVSIHRDNKEEGLVSDFFSKLTGQKSRTVKIKIKKLRFRTAYVISPWYRRLWGILKTGQIESLGTNWSINSPGFVVLPEFQFGKLRRNEKLAAHEAGHIFGLGDAYGAIYRFFYNAPATKFYMMNSNYKVQPKEIVMLLKAHQTGKMQFFSRKWDSKIFKEGFNKEIEVNSKKIEKYFEAKKRR